MCVYMIEQDERICTTGKQSIPEALLSKNTSRSLLKTGELRVIL